MANIHFRFHQCVHTITLSTLHYYTVSLKETIVHTSLECINFRENFDCVRNGNTWMWFGERERESTVSFVLYSIATAIKVHCSLCFDENTMISRNKSKIIDQMFRLLRKKLNSREFIWRFTRTLTHSKLFSLYINCLVCLFLRFKYTFCHYFNKSPD